MQLTCAALLLIPLSPAVLTRSEFQPSADDSELKEWVKLPGQLLPQPAAAMQLTGWRDPFILEQPSASSPWWYVMVGAGVKSKCGTALVYRSRDLKQGEHPLLVSVCMHACLCLPSVYILHVCCLEHQVVAL
jgi:hypothetical protein